MNFNRINPRRVIIFHDFSIATLAWLLSWWLRFNLDFPYFNWQMSLYLLPVVLLVQGLVYRRFKLHKGLWRFASLSDLWSIIRASIIGALLLTLIFSLWFRLEGVPRSILIIYPVLLIFLLGGARLTYRMFKEHSMNLNRSSFKKKVLLAGAGTAGEILVREILRDGNYQPVGFVDDDEKLSGREIHGVRVLGNIQAIPDLCQHYDVDLIVLAIPSASNQQMQTIISMCEKTQCEIRILPNISDVVSGKVTVNHLRQVTIEDLLCRENAKLDWDIIRQGISSRIVMVTGGGGSIGSQLCKQLVELSPAKLIVLDHSEYNLYRIEQQLRKNVVDCEFILGNLCDREQIDQLIQELSPDIIFHAAAYKHVPILERQPREAVLNNVMGTKHIADAAGENQCERFVLISTDKAVNPASILGATKRAAEIYIETLNNIYETKYMIVRFGNVLDSEGSVVPLFKEQIKMGGPITVTHPEITRYFMTIPEACQLIMQASSMGKGGEIYVLDMGEPVKIRFLAEQIARLSGLQPGKDIEIVYTGLRSGEKMYEELFYNSENQKNTDHKKILIASYPMPEEGRVKKKIEKLIQAANNFDNEEIIIMMKQIVLFQEVEKDNVTAFNKSSSTS